MNHKSAVQCFTTMHCTIFEEIHKDAANNREHLPSIKHGTGGVMIVAGFSVTRFSAVIGSVMHF